MKSGLKCVLATIATILLMATPVIAVELFRYRGAAKDGGTLEYVFDAGDQNSPNAITKEKVAEIAADFMTTFYHEQVGALVCRAALFRGNGAGSAAHYFVGSGTWGTG
jgi:hypothetical protein